MPDRGAFGAGGAVFVGGASVTVLASAECDSCALRLGGSPGPSPRYEERDQAGGSSAAHGACARWVCTGDSACAVRDAGDAEADDDARDLPVERVVAFASFAGDLVGAELAVRACVPRCCDEEAADVWADGALDGSVGAVAVNACGAMEATLVSALERTPSVPRAGGALA